MRDGVARGFGRTDGRRTTRDGPRADGRTMDAEGSDEGWGIDGRRADVGGRRGRR